VDLCARAFDLAVTEVRSQNAPYLIGTLLANRVGGPTVWELVKSSWETLLDRFPDNSHNRMLATVRTLCGTSELASDVEAFLTAHPLRSGQRSVDQTLERLRINTAFAQRHRADLGAMLAAIGRP
jgi:ERAP1-like C-terminal domain